MSVTLAVLTKKLCLIACDTRASTEDGSFQDNVPKAFLLNSGTIVSCAGSVGGIKKFVHEYRKHEDLFQIPKDSWPDGAVHAVVFKPLEKKIFEITGHYEETENVSPFVIGIGSGGDIAETAFNTYCDALKIKLDTITEKDLRALMIKSIQKAFDKNLFCGGEIKVLGGKY